MGLFVKVAKVYNLVHFYCTPSRCRILLNSWMWLYGNKTKHNNWGDDLNYFLVKELSGKKIFNLRQLTLKGYSPQVDNICCIGSIIEDHPTRRSLIWGAGCISGEVPIAERPKRVFAVRGPLTRDYLIQQGVESPSIYGDPALLLPLVYSPKRKERTKIGIIPNHLNLKDPSIGRLMEYPNTVLIDLKNYKDWHEVVDTINECEYVLSRSLHGLIVSDAYGIPNLWIEFSTKIDGSGIKFLDYFASVGRKTSKAVRIGQSTSMEKLLEYKDEWEPIRFDARALLKACPFELKRKYRLYASKSN